MKNFFRLAVTAVFIVACVLFGVNENVCSAEYTTSDGYTPNGRFYSAGVMDAFFKSDKGLLISMYKINLILNDDPRDFYLYMMEICQETNQSPFNIKSITIMSETDSVEIPANDSYRQTGLDFVTDRISYRDTGKVNRVIKSVWSKMLIRITTTGGVVYDIYPSEEYIADAKKVADWASH